jgi:hypothetical protein
MRRIPLCLLFLALTACGGANDKKASTGRTERETDSVIANSKVPNHQAVGAAMRAADSTSREVRRGDSTGAEP